MNLGSCCQNFCWIASNALPFSEWMIQFKDFLFPSMCFSLGKYQPTLPRPSTFCYVDHMKERIYLEVLRLWACTHGQHKLYIRVKHVHFIEVQVFHVRFAIHSHIHPPLLFSLYPTGLFIKYRFRICQVQLLAVAGLVPGLVVNFLLSTLVTMQKRKCCWKHQFLSAYSFIH